MLFLHGIGGNRRNWDRQLEAFSGCFRAAAWDARGYGNSEDYEGPLDFADFWRDLERVLDHLAAQRAHLVGLSMGGRIARDFALQRPHRVASLTLANSSPGFDALSPEAADAYLAARRIPGAELVEIQGAGHLSNIEQPGRFNEAVLAFLARCR